MRRVGQFRYLLRRPPAPKIEDSPDIVSTQYGPERVQVVVEAKRKKNGKTKMLAQDWAEAAIASAFPDAQLPEIEVVDMGAEPDPEPEPEPPTAEMIEEVEAMVAFERPNVRVARMELKQWMRGDDGYQPIFDNYLDRMCTHLYDEGLRGSALRSFNYVRSPNLNAFSLRYLFRAARKLGEMTDTTAPGPAALRQAFREANISTAEVDEEDGAVVPDEGPSQLRVPRTPTRNPTR